MHGEMAGPGALQVRREGSEGMAILRRLMAENPGSSWRNIVGPFSEEVGQNPAALREVMVYFVMNFHSYETGRRSPERTTAQRVQDAKRLLQRTALAQSINDQLDRMNLTLPNGKLVRDATRADLQHAGGWFVKVAKKLKGKQTVGEVLTEADLQAIK